MRVMTKILIVDDNTLNLDILRDALKETYKLSIAKNGKIALKILERNVPDLILLDVMMPVMDGYETYQHIAKDERLKGIPIVFLSGVDVLEHGIENLEPGRFVKLVHKPFNIPDVLSMIQTALKGDG